MVSTSHPDGSLDCSPEDEDAEASSRSTGIVVAKGSPVQPPEADRTRNSLKNSHFFTLEMDGGSRDTI